jgi:hypothetical protein
MPHTHVIDGKTIEFDDTSCPMCHPSQTPDGNVPKPKTYPSCYRKGTTVVLMLSKTQMVTLNFWTTEKLYLMDISKMMLDRDNKAVLDQNRKPVWNKATVRITPPMLRTWLTETSTLLSEIENQATVPKRD